MPELKDAFNRFQNRLFDPGEVSKESVRRNRDMANVLLHSVANPGVIQSPTQGVALLVNAMNARALQERANRGEVALKELESREMGDFLAGLDLTQDQEQTLQNAPDSLRNQLMGSVAAQQFAPPKEDQIGHVQLREGGNFVTRRTINGRVDMSDAGMLATSAIDRNSSTGGNRETKILDAMSQIGMDRADAVKIVDGHSRIETDDFGRSRIVDLTNGTVREINVQPANTPQPSEGPTQTLFELAPLATGIVPTLTAGASQASGALGGPISEETVQARQTFNTSTNDFIRALSINPRFPVAEINRIREEINLAPGIFDSGELMQNRMISIDRSLRGRLQTESSAANDPSLPEQTRKDAASAAKDIQNFLDLLGVPQATQTATDIPSGFDPELWPFLTPEEQQELLNGQ